MKFWKFAILCAGVSLAVIAATKPAQAQPAPPGKKWVEMKDYKCDPTKFYTGKEQGLPGCLYGNPDPKVRDMDCQMYNVKVQGRTVITQEYQTCFAGGIPVVTR